PTRHSSSLSSLESIAYPFSVLRTLTASVLAVLDGRALDRQQLLEIDDLQHILLDRAPVGLGLAVCAQPVRQLLVDLLPRRVRRQERRRGIGDDPVAETAEIRQAQLEAGETAPAREIHQRAAEPLGDRAKLLRRVRHREQQQIGAGAAIRLAPA